MRENIRTFVHALRSSNVSVDTVRLVESYFEWVDPDEQAPLTLANVRREFEGIGVRRWEFRIEDMRRMRQIQVVDVGPERNSSIVADEGWEDGKAREKTDTETRTGEWGDSAIKRWLLGRSRSRQATNNQIGIGVLKPTSLNHPAPLVVGRKNKRARIREAMVQGV